MKKTLTLMMIFTFLMILSACATVSSLGRAAKDGDIKRVEALLNEGADVNAVVTPGLSPLHEAVFNDASLDIVRLMLDRGADVNKKSCGDGWAGSCNCSTPLYIAACKGNVKMVKLLLDYGADVSLVHYDKKTPLQIAQEQGSTTVVRMLKEAEEKQIKTLYADSEKHVLPSVGKDPSGSIPKSDVDDLPALKAKPNKNAYAIVIGIENYRQKLPKADYAAADARTVTEYLIKVMGYPEENIVTLTNENATKSDFEKYFEKWIYNNAEKGSTIFIYYSGHGAPNTRTGDAYLVPYDGDPSFIEQTGYPLKKLYESLNKLQAKEIIVALDSCFSGAGGRSVIAKGSRPLVMNLQSNVILSKNMTVLSASSGDQTSSTYDEKRHGLFTYFLLKGIKNEDVVKQDGSLAIGDLFNYMKPQVERIARKQYNNEQTPQLINAKKN
ncbi:MAG: ankyrin repeat domain-containing protein [Smithellaceae bacterium]